MTKRIIGLILAIAAIAVIVIAAIRHNTYTSMIGPAATEMPAPEKTGQKKPAPETLRADSLIIRKSKCSTDFKRNDFLKKNEAYPLGALRSLKFAYRKLRISLFVELAV